MNTIDLMEKRSKEAQERLDNSLFGQINKQLSLIPNKRLVKEWKLSSETALQMKIDYDRWLIDVELKPRSIGDQISSFYGRPVVLDDSVPFGSVLAVNEATTDDNQ